ncbi:MAG: hypothetical protein RIQ81_935, partial [Pseudomonadota bacterium]
GKGGRNIRDGRGTQEGIDDAVSVISRDDGKFDVTCKDGTKEVVTGSQLKNGDVCGGSDAPVPGNGVHAFFAKGGGSFYVLCDDKSWELGTAGQIQNGSVCGTDPGPNKRVFSDGTEQRPVCSWSEECKWDQAAMEECAEKLCQASGFSGGKFVESTNNPCTTSKVDGTTWAWRLDKGDYHRAGYDKESLILADCY